MALRAQRGTSGAFWPPGAERRRRRRQRRPWPRSDPLLPLRRTRRLRRISQRSTADLKVRVDRPADEPELGGSGGRRTSLAALASPSAVGGSLGGGSVGGRIGRGRIGRAPLLDRRGRRVLRSGASRSLAATTAARAASAARSSWRPWRSAPSSLRSTATAPPDEKPLRAEKGLGAPLSLAGSSRFAPGDKHLRSFVAPRGARSRLITGLASPQGSAAFMARCRRCRERTGVLLRVLENRRRSYPSLARPDRAAGPSRRPSSLTTSAAVPCDSRPASRPERLRLSLRAPEREAG